jgi:dihydropteroate synthase
VTVERQAPPEAAVSGSGRAGSVWRTARRAIDLSKPVLMGILNVTPDSFYDGGRFRRRDAALQQLDRLAQQGADIIDIGGESTRPGAAAVSADEETRRVLPLVEAAAERVDAAISIDTTKTAVARAAVEAGAEIINDISGLRFDPGLGDLAAQRRAGLVLMHSRGEPRTMQKEIHYDDLLDEIKSELATSVEVALEAGCSPEQLAVDPGIGFGKTAEHNLRLIARLDRIAALGLPMLVGPSRKSFIGATLGLPVEERLEATIAVCVVALMRGARIFRVHDVGAVRRALDMAEAITKQLNGAESI